MVTIRFIFYTTNSQIAALASPLVLWIAVGQLGDCTQIFYANVLRAYKLTTPPVVISCAVRWGMGLPLGYYLAFGHYQLGVQGLWIASSGALTLAGVTLAWFTTRYPSKSSIRRQRAVNAKSATGPGRSAVQAVCSYVPTRSDAS